MRWALVLVGIFVMAQFSPQQLAQMLMMIEQAQTLPPDLAAVFRSGAARVDPPLSDMPPPPEHRPGVPQRDPGSYFEGIENDLPKRSPAKRR